MKRYVPIENDSLIENFQTHDMRKTNLTKQLREDGMNIAAIQKYARHKKIDNTMKYVGYTEDENVQVQFANLRA